MTKKHFKRIFVIAAVMVLFFILLTFLLSGNRLPIGEKVAVVEIVGLITDPDPITKQIKDYGERDDIKAIVVRIDSPGGGVGPSQEIYSELKKLSNKKKVVASMGSIAASGGYYIAVAANKIVANPGTITGSIGVVMRFANVEDLLSKIGYKGYVIKSGAYKDIGSPFRRMTEEEKRLLQDVIDDVHQQFMGVVAENRKLEMQKVKKLADGRIFSGSRAKAMGLIDDIGNFQDAIDIASSMADIKGKPYVLYPERKVRFWNFIFGEEASALFSRIKGGYELMYFFPFGATDR